MDSNGKAPNYISSSIGNVRYESLVYMYSLIMDYYGNKTYCHRTSLNSMGISFQCKYCIFNLDQIQDATKTVEAYVETNHQLPTLLQSLEQL